MFRVIKASTDIDLSYTIEERNSIFIARASNGYAISSGTSEEYVRNSADKLIAQQGPAAVIPQGKSCEFDPNNYSRSVFMWLWKNAAKGSVITMKNGKTYTRGADDTWRFYNKATDRMYHYCIELCAIDKIEDVQSFYLIKRGY